MNPLLVSIGLWLCGLTVTFGNATLIDVLSSGSASVEKKAQACRELGEKGVKDAVPALAALLSDKALGAYARAGLERIPGPSPVAALRAALSTTEGAARDGVIQSLGALRDAESVSLLLPLAGTNKAALLALGRIATDECVAEVRQKLAEGAAGSETACLLVAEGLLKRGQRLRAITIYDALTRARIAEPYRVAATRGAIMTRQSVPFLLNKLKSRERAIRDVALLAIHSMPKSDELARGLHQALADADVPMRLRLIAALRVSNNKETVRVLSDQSKHESHEVRLAAIRAVGSLGGSQAVAVLLSVLERDGISVEELAVVESELRAQPGNDTDLALTAALQSAKSPKHRIRLVKLLGDRLSVSAKSLLLKQASDPDFAVSMAALRSVRRLVGVGDIPTLIALVKRTDRSDYRKAAGDALASACVDAKEGSDLQQALRASTDPEESMQWVRALTAMGDSSALYTIAKRADPAMIAQLARWANLDPLPVLFEIVESAQTTTAMRAAALTTCLQLLAKVSANSREDLVPDFRRAFRATNSHAHKLQLIAGLRNVQDPDGLQLLGGFLNDDSVRDEAALAFVQAAWPMAQAGAGTALIAASLAKLPKIEDRGYRQKVAMLKAALIQGR